MTYRTALWSLIVLASVLSFAAVMLGLAGAPAPAPHFPSPAALVRPGTRPDAAEKPVSAVADREVTEEDRRRVLLLLFFGVPSR